MTPKSWTAFWGYFMTKKQRYSFEYKLNVIQHYLSNNGFDSTAYFFKITPSLVRQWYKIYEKHGSVGLKPRTSRTEYSLEYKVKVVSYLLKTGASLLDVAAHFNGPNDTVILKWKNIYLKEGPLALQSRKIKVNRIMADSKDLNNQDVKEKTAKELEAELLYLRAENAILKKYLALGEKKRQTQKKRK